MQVFQWQMCSDPQADAHRYMDAINGAIAVKAVKRYAAFTAWAKLTAAKPRPKVKACRTEQRQDDTALVAQIRCVQTPGSAGFGIGLSLHADTPNVFASYFL